jgi:anti-anti-sigma factor
MRCLRPGELRLDHHSSPTRSVLELSGELDLTTSRSVLELVSSLLQEQGRMEIQIDLRHLGFIDSAGLRALLRSSQLCREAGRGFAVVAPHEGPSRTLFEIARVTDQLSLQEDLPPFDRDARLVVESILSTPQLMGGARASRLALRTSGDGDRHTLTVAGELEGGTAPVLLAAVGRICKDGASRVVLDLDGLVRLGAGGSRALADARAICSRSGCDLVLTLPSSETCRRELEQSGAADGLTADLDR